MKKILLLLLLTLFCINSYAQISFENKVVIDNRNATNTPRAVYTADIDGDGYTDILSASSDDSKVAWYKNDGEGNFGNQQIISTEGFWANSVFAIDIDGDGDIDVLSASSYDNKIAWYENLDGLGTFGPEQIITLNATGARSVIAIDIDGDGDMDVVSASGDINEGKIAWYENIDGLGNFGPQNIINPSAVSPTSVYAADIDNDGDVDILSTAGLSNGLVWYENLDGYGNFGSEKIIDADNGFTYSVKVADIDNDGDMDVISASSSAGNGTIAWYENLDGEGYFSAKKTITSLPSNAFDVFVADIDGDGDFDVISGLYKEQGLSIEWYENLDGSGNFGAPNSVNTSSGTTISIYVTDIDNNGTLDIISASEDRIGFNKNLDGNGNFGTHKYFTYNVDFPVSVQTADIDGDGKIDIVSASDLDGEIAWYKNLDGRGDFSIQKTISLDNYGVKAVVAKDLDGDGDIDVLYTALHHLAWQENLDGNGLFSEKRIIADEIGMGYFDVAAEDLDGDGDLDIIVTGFFYGKLSWFENLDGQGTFGLERIIDDNSFTPVNVEIVDINNDGKLDVVCAFLQNGKVSWYKNLGSGNFAPAQIINSSYNNNIDFVHAADLDGDNDLDIIITQRLDGEIVWFENLDGLGNFGYDKIIASGLDTPIGVYTTDLDNDGDLDLVSVSFYGDVVDWYENIDGAGNFGPQNIIMNEADGANFVLSNDIDGDGDMDVIASIGHANEIRWFKNSLILGVNETATLNFSIYPNPASNTLNITLEKTIQQVEVFNNLEQLATKNVEILNERNSQLNISKLAAGVYFIKLKTTDGEIGVRKFIKR